MRNPDPRLRELERQAAVLGTAEARLRYQQELNRRGRCACCEEERERVSVIPEDDPEEGLWLCNVCSALRELGLFEQATVRYQGYVSEQSPTVPGYGFIATFRGFPLVSLNEFRRAGQGWHGVLLYHWAGQDGWGRWWHGTNQGRAMSTNMRLYHTSKMPGRVFRSEEGIPSSYDLVFARTVRQAQARWLEAATGKQSHDLLYDAYYVEPSPLPTDVCEHCGRVSGWSMHEAGCPRAEEDEPLM